MTTSRILPAAILGASALLLGACSGNIDISFDKDVPGSGTITTETYDLSDFDAITICCDLDIEIQVNTSSDADVQVTTDDNLQDRLKVEVKGDTLSIRPKADNEDLEPTGQIVVSIPSFGISELKVSSASTVTGEFQSIEDFTVRVSEAARVNIEVDADNLTLWASSASDVTLSGRAAALDVDIDRAASADLDQLDVEDASIDASSAASVDVTVTGTVGGTVSSGASLQISGDPKSTNVDTSSGGTVDNI